MKTLPVEMLDLKSIEVLDFVERPPTPTDDERDARSIRLSGIQEPLFVVRDEGRDWLVKGSRRRRIALSLGIPKARCVIDTVPAGQTRENYIRQIRFILHEHRQDPLPSVLAGLIVKMKDLLGLNNVQVATYFGIDQDTVTNRTAILRLIPDIVAAIDSGVLTNDAARVFNGMSKEGQRAVWEKHRGDMTGTGKGKIHKTIRKLYPPQKFPSYYDEPEKIAARLGRAKQKRKAKVTYTTDEKKRLLASYSVKEEERVELDDEAKTLKRQCIAAGPIVAAILRTPTLKKLVPDSMRPELERFSEVY